MADAGESPPQSGADVDAVTAPMTPGEFREVAEGVYLIANPVAFPPGFQNAVLLADESPSGAPSWTIVDPGLKTAEADLDAHLTAQFPSGVDAERRITRVVATHHHPDHIGAAGALQRRGAELLTTRTAWLYARMLHLGATDQPPPEAEAFYRRAGFDEAQLEGWRERSRLNFAAMVAPLPLGFTLLKEGDTLSIGARRWRVLMGHGHAPDHLLLWRPEEKLLIAGDQILPKISPNIGVYPAEPEGDPLGDWIDSCRRLAAELGETPDTLTLPGHGDPFYDPSTRLLKVAAKHEAALERLETFLDSPRTVVECFQPMFRRVIPDSHNGLAVGETLSHLHRLMRQGRARRSMRSDGVHLYRRA
ncbi:MAG: MBL fold metallo-hydrolase [Pseudomonadota bacterium]